MDILDVVKPFAQHVSPDCLIHMTIGKFVGKTFNPNNKIFFDFLKTYLNKNGWFIAKQYMLKKIYYHGTPHMRKCIVEPTPSVVIGLDLPVTHTTVCYTTLQEHQYIYKGTYFDMHCHQAHTVEAAPATLGALALAPETEEVGPSEEISVMNKHLCAISVIFAVSHSQPPCYSVQVRLASVSELDKEELKALFTIIELAMCKYKKTERTFGSVFT